MRKVIRNEWLLMLSGVASVAFGGLLLFAPAAGERAAIHAIGAYRSSLGSSTSPLDFAYDRSTCV